MCACRKLESLSKGRGENIGIKGEGSWGWEGKWSI